MRALAAFAMRSRGHALGVAVAGAALPFCTWISAATIALVTLRKGGVEGFWVALWALLPTFVYWKALGDSTPLTLVLGVLLLALALRSSVSLAFAVLCSSAVAILTGIVMLLAARSYLQQLETFFAQLFAQMQEVTDQPLAAAPVAVQLAGLLGLMTAASSVLCLLLGRYWQAVLYKPGGFAEEFRQLRYPPAVALGLVAAAAGVFMLGVVYRPWAAAFVVPLTVAAFAVVHALSAQRGKGNMLLVLVYGSWLLFDAAKVALVTLAVVDSFVDFRGRGARSKGDDR